MHWNRVLGLSSLVVALAFASPASAARIQGVGSQLCSKFNENVRTMVVGPGDISWEQYAYAWAQGWLSRLNVDREATGRATVPDLSPDGFGPKEQMAFMRNYCASYPAQQYARGVDEIYGRLLRMYGLIS